MDGSQVGTDWAEAAAAGVTELPPAGTAVHVGVVKTFVAFHVAMLAILFWTFRRDAETVFMIAIVTFYLCMYLGGPLVMVAAGGLREAATTPQTWKQFLDGRFATWTGELTGREVRLQICLIPAAATVLLFAFSFLIARAQGG